MTCVPTLPLQPEDDVPGMTRETTILTEPDDDFFAAKQPTLPSVREEEALQDGNDLYEMRADSRYSFTNPPGVRDTHTHTHAHARTVDDSVGRWAWVKPSLLFQHAFSSSYSALCVDGVCLK